MKKILCISVGFCILLGSVIVWNGSPFGERDQSLEGEIAILRAAVDHSAPDLIAVRQQVQSIADAFIAEVEKEGYTHPYIPKVEIIVTPSLMFFASTEEEGYLIAPNWDSVPPAVQETMNTWLEDVHSAYTGEVFFERNFNWFLVPHELGHFLQETQKHFAYSHSDHWTAELVANKIAIAFFLSQGMEREVEAFIAETSKLIEYLGSPALGGVSDREFFNENYDELGEDPRRYGYYQFLLYKEAWGDRATLTSIFFSQ